MHVFHLAANLGPNSIGRRLSYLVPKLKALGVSQTVGVLGGDDPFGDSLRECGVVPVKFAIRNRLDLSGMLRLRRYVAALKPDLVHFWGRDADWYSQALRRSLWDAMPPMPCRWTWERRQADEPVTDPHRSHAASGLCNLPRTDRRTKSEARAALGVAADARLVLAFDHFESVEPMRNAVWAIDLMKPTSPLWRLMILGDGPARVRVQRFAGKLAADDDRVTFLGVRRDVEVCITACDVVWSLVPFHNTQFRFEALRRTQLAMGPPPPPGEIHLDDTPWTATSPVELGGQTIEEFDRHPDRAERDRHCEELAAIWHHDGPQGIQAAAVLAEYEAALR